MKDINVPLAVIISDAILESLDGGIVSKSAVTDKVLECLNNELGVCYCDRLGSRSKRDCRYCDGDYKCSLNTPEFNSKP
jgi:hypothetical protein